MKEKVSLQKNLIEMTASRWGSCWAKSKIIVGFSDGNQHAPISLDPQSTKKLRNELQILISSFEKTNGILWSENHPQLAMQNDLRLFGYRSRENDDLNASFPAISAAASSFYSVLRNLPLEGCERSFKMLSRVLLSERFLAGLPLSMIAPEDVMAIAEQLRIPETLRESFASEISHAVYLHAGFEQGLNDSTCKLYLEYAPGSGKPLYTGYKWDAHQVMRHTVSHYRLLPGLSSSAMCERIAQAYGDAHAPASITAGAILALANSRLAPEQRGQLLFVDVTDQDTSRHSFDINVYESGLLVRDAIAPLRELAGHLALPNTEFDELLHTTEGDILGHISGGVDRNGEAFLTIYHARTD